MKAKINGVRINYQLSGKTDGPVVALSHSLGSSLAMWEPQMGSLEPHFRVLRYDTRGHGASDAPEGAYSLDQLGEDAVGLLDALGIDVAHWVGLSMGGMIGQSYRKKPNRCGKSGYIEPGAGEWAPWLRRRWSDGSRHLI